MAVKMWRNEVASNVNAVRERLLALTGNPGWLYRGQSRKHSELIPSIDRAPLGRLPRIEKLEYERTAIETLRLYGHVCTGAERAALDDDFTALALLRHYDVPCRLLDWTTSPLVAALFACLAEADGVIWSFSLRAYEPAAEQQWRIHTETTVDGSGDPQAFDAKLTAFSVDEPEEWIVQMHYPRGFDRQHAQRGRYTLSSRYGIDHAEALARLLPNSADRVCYTIPEDFKQDVLRWLAERGVNEYSLYPDIAGLARVLAGTLKKSC